MPTIFALFLSFLVCYFSNHFTPNDSLTLSIMTNQNEMIAKRTRHVCVHWLYILVWSRGITFSSTFYFQRKVRKYKSVTSLSAANHSPSSLPLSVTLNSDLHYISYQSTRVSIFWNGTLFKSRHFLKSNWNMTESWNVNEKKIVAKSPRLLGVLKINSPLAR